MKRMDADMIRYERQLIDKIGKTKGLTLKKLWMAIELQSLVNAKR